MKKNTNGFIKIPQFDKNSLKLKLFTDASFNNLSNGGSQTDQIILLNNSRNNCCPVYWNPSKIKRVVGSTLAAETLVLSDGGDINSMSTNYYLNPSRHRFNKCDCLCWQQKPLWLDILSLHEMVNQIKVQIMWTEKDKQKCFNRSIGTTEPFIRNTTVL